MVVDAKTGTITLTSGFLLSPSTTRTNFEAARLHDPARVSNPGTPWFYFPFQDGNVDGKYLGVTPCFYKSALVSVNFGVHHYPESATSWENFSLETEEQAQRSHAEMLEMWFGPPHTCSPSGFQDAKFPLLHRTLGYSFVWGHAWSGFDQRAHFVSAGLRYSKNDAWASADYDKERKHLKVSKLTRWFQKSK